MTTVAGSSIFQQFIPRTTSQMRYSNRYLVALLVVFLPFLYGSPASAAPRQIAASNGMVATVSDRPDWCRDTVIVSVKAPSQDIFVGERVALQRFLGQVRLPIEEECPKARFIRVAGIVEPRGTVFFGSASKESGWNLVTSELSTTVAPQATANPRLPAPPPASVPVASAVIKSGSTPAGADVYIQTCDRLGAHPNDPEAFAKGVPDNKLHALEVIKVCETAARQSNAPRLAFQLARGYWKANRMEDAIEQLLGAAKQGHGASLAYLGEVYLDGAPGIEPDPAQARLLYARAFAAGFAPATTILAQFEDYTDKSIAADLEEMKLQPLAAATPPSMKMGYVRPDVIENILRGDLDEVSNNELWVKNYLIEVADSIGQECKKHFTPSDIKSLKATAAIRSVDSSASGGIASLYNAMENMSDVMGSLRNGGGVGGIAERGAREDKEYEIASMKLLEEGIKDSFVLIMKHPCGSQQLSSFAKNLTAYVEDAGAPRQSAEQLYQSCQRTQNKNKTKQGGQFCFCIARKLVLGASMTRGERKGLASSFEANAQKIIDKNRDHFRPCF